MPLINHHHGVVGQYLLRADVDVRVGDRGEADDVGFADLFEEIGDEFVEFDRGRLRCSRCGGWFSPASFCRVFFAAASSGTSGLAMRLSEVLRTGTLRCISTLAAAEEAMGFAGFMFSAGRAAECGQAVGAIGAVRAGAFGSGLGNDNCFFARGAFDFGTGTGSIDLKFLFTVGAVEDDVHNQCGCDRA